MRISIAARAQTWSVGEAVETQRLNSDERMQPEYDQREAMC